MTCQTTPSQKRGVTLLLRYAVILKGCFIDATLDSVRVLKSLSSPPDHLRSRPLRYARSYFRRGLLTHWPHEGCGGAAELRVDWSTFVSFLKSFQNKFFQSCCWVSVNFFQTCCWVQKVRGGCWVTRGGSPPLHCYCLMPKLPTFPVWSPTIIFYLVDFPYWISLAGQVTFSGQG